MVEKCNKYHYTAPFCFHSKLSWHNLNTLVAESFIWCRSLFLIKNSFTFWVMLKPSSVTLYEWIQNCLIWILNNFFAKSFCKDQIEATISIKQSGHQQINSRFLMEIFHTFETSFLPMMSSHSNFHIVRS